MKEKVEIQMKLIDLESDIRDLVQKPKRFKSFNHDEKIANLRGQIQALEWVQIKEDINVIEQ